MILSDRVTGHRTWRGLAIAGLLALAAAPSWSWGQPAPPLTEFEHRLLLELRLKEMTFKVSELEQKVKAFETEKRREQPSKAERARSDILIDLIASLETKRTDMVIKREQMRIQIKQLLGGCATPGLRRLAGSVHDVPYT